jgi:hypothetical protein
MVRWGCDEERLGRDGGDEEDGSSRALGGIATSLFDMCFDPRRILTSSTRARYLIKSLHASKMRRLIELVTHVASSE